MRLGCSAPFADRLLLAECTLRHDRREPNLVRLKHGPLFGRQREAIRASPSVFPLQHALGMPLNRLALEVLSVRRLSPSRPTRSKVAPTARAS